MSESLRKSTPASRVKALSSLALSVQDRGPIGADIGKDSFAGSTATNAAITRAEKSPFFQTTPDVIDAGIAQFCRSIGSLPPTYVDVSFPPGMEAGRCCFNVECLIAHFGGQAVFGRIIWEGKLFLTAEFHAVWLAPDGAAVDVTPKPDGETTILFSPDPRYPPNFDFMKRPENRTMRTYCAPTRDVEGAIARMSAGQRAYEERRAARKGTTLAETISAKRLADVVERDVDEFLGCSARKDLLLRPTPRGLVCTDEASYTRLVERMMALQNGIERAWFAAGAGR